MSKTKKEDEPSQWMIGMAFIAICGLAMLIMFLVWLRNSALLDTGQTSASAMKIADRRLTLT